MEIINRKFSLTPGQRLAVDVAVSVGFVVIGAFIGSKMGQRSGYKRGLKDGTSPVDKARLEVAHDEGYNDGWWDGAWANDNETLIEGIRIGRSISRGEFASAPSYLQPAPAQQQAQLQPA